jgi:hypothetical protein
MFVLKPFREVAPGVLESREGGGPAAIFGLPFLAAGLFVTLIGLQVVRVQNAHEVPWWGWAIAVFMGLAFVAAGSALVLGRAWTRLEVSRGRILKQWGLLAPMRSEELSLRNFTGMCLKFHGGDSDSVDRYPVLLTAAAGGKDLELYSSTNYGEARERAAFLARFLKLPLTDGSTEHHEVLEAEPKDVTGRPELAAAPATPAAYQPQSMRARIEERADSVQITIPDAQFRFSMLLGVVIPICLLAYFSPQLLAFFQRTKTPEPVQRMFLGFLVFMFGVLPLLSLAFRILRGLRSHTRIVASREGLVIENRGAIFTHRKDLPAKDILGLDYSTSGGLLAAAQAEAERRHQHGAMPPWQHGARSASLPGWVEKLARLAKSKGITVKTKAGLFTFAAGLPDDEVCYLYALVRRSLGSR